MNASVFKAPPILKNHLDNPRKVGVEIEMSGIELSMIVCQINIAFGGRIKEISRYEFVVEATRLGDFKIELDSRQLRLLEKQKLANPDLQAEPIPDLEMYTKDMLAALSKNLVPCEVVAPPLPIDQLHELNTVVELLRRHDAKGTRTSLFYAFGVHLNPELPDLQAGTLLNYLKAFICLQDWLVEAEQVDLTRKLSPFIDDFPKAYKHLILQPDYQPAIERLVADYLQHNPTRNRILDMLPVFAFLDEAPIKQALGEEKLNKRPTLHYRLPNSDIDNPDWGLEQCWNNWLAVEKLANDPDRLARVSAAYLQTQTSQLPEMLKPWIDSLKELMADR